MRKANIFGLGWIGDDATIKRISLMIMLVLCEREAPVVISICNCTNHIIDGKKKDAEYIRKFFKDKVEEWDPSNCLTDCFFFDGVANVQKAGEILCANFPRALCFHGVKHVLSLFFKDLSTWKSIQVRRMFHF